MALLSALAAAGPQPWGAAGKADPIHIRGIVLQPSAPQLQALSLAGVRGKCGSKANSLCKRGVLPACLPCGTEISPVVTRALCQLLSPV